MLTFFFFYVRIKLKGDTMFDFKDDAIIVCNNKVKNKILKEAFEEKRLINYTFYSLQQFMEKFYFKITTKAYLFAANFLNLSYENSKVITPSIYYVDLSEKYVDLKLIELQALKKELMALDLLEIDSLFKTFLGRKKVYVYKTDLDNFFIDMFSKVEMITSVEYFAFDDQYPLEKVIEFADYQKEIEYVFTEIRKQLDKGMDINSLHIVNTDSHYNHVIERYATLFKIPVLINDGSRLDTNIEVHDFIEGLMNDESIVGLVEKICNQDVKSKIINLINEYQEFGTDVLIHEIKHRTIVDENLFDVVKVVDIDYGFQEDDYVYIVNFTNGTLPKIFIDDDYLGDKYVDILPITSVVDKNKNARNKAIYLMSSIKNKTITYAKIANDEKVASSLIRILNLPIEKREINHNYSKELAKLEYAKLMDDYINYGTRTEKLALLSQVFVSEYNKYDNQFSWVDTELLRQKLGGKIKLSYSSVSTFFKCQFYYFLDKVLKIPYLQDTSAADLGTAFHSILEVYHSESFDLEKERLAKRDAFDNKVVKHYFDKLWPDFLMVLKFIDSISEYTILRQEKHENEISVDFSDDYWQKEFMGFIDKIMYQNIDGVDYLAIVDYKTGNTQSSSLDNVVYGFNLQLPVYAYLVMRSKLFANPQILGTYLHYIYADATLSNNKSVEDSKWNALKLEGYSISDMNLLKLLDSSFKDSQFIKSMKVKNTGEFYGYTKVLDKEHFIKLVDIVDNLLKEAFTMIENGDFKINPKYINQKNQSCTYCHYKDICYVCYDNKVDLKEQKIMDILGGE